MRLETLTSLILLATPLPGQAPNDASFAESQSVSTPGKPE